MSRGLGKMQRRVLALLTTPCQECERMPNSTDLESIARGLTVGEPGEICWCDGLSEPAPASVYKSAARAVVGLEKRGLVRSEYKQGSHVSWEESRKGMHGGGYRWKRLSVEQLAKSEANQHLTGGGS